MQFIKFCVIRSCYVIQREWVRSPFIAHFQLLVLGFANNWCVLCFSLCLTALIFWVKQQARDSLFGWLMAASLLTSHSIKRSSNRFPKVITPVPVGDQSQQSNNKNRNEKSHIGLSPQEEYHNHKCRFFPLLWLAVYVKLTTADVLELYECVFFFFFYHFNLMRNILHKNDQFLYSY